MPRPSSNPPNRFLPQHVEWLEAPPDAEVEVREEQARSILSENDSPDLGFRWSLNPYRGCQHACAYCYARPTHQYIGLGAGTDFDTKITVKVNAPELLDKALSRPSWRGESITFSGVTDCYQPLEARYQLTRRCLEVCRRRHNPLAIITKAALVRRDADLLAELSRDAGCTVYLSIPFADEELGRKIEPGASAPSLRFETLRVLSEAGVEVGVAVAPVIPGLNEDQLARVLERAAGAGAKRAFMSSLRLSAEVLPVFRERLERAFPERAKKVWHAIEELRGGKLNESAFGARMRGRGERWRVIEELFRMQCRRLGLEHGPAGERADPPAHREPGPKASQGLLFED